LSSVVCPDDVALHQCVIIGSSTAGTSGLYRPASEVQRLRLKTRLISVDLTIES